MAQWALEPIIDIVTLILIVSLSFFFNSRLESVKSQFAKTNIAYQINLSRLTERRLIQLEELIKNCTNLHYFIKGLVNRNSDLLDKNFKEYPKFYQEADLSAKTCSLYISKELREKIEDVIENCHKVFSYFTKMKKEDPNGSVYSAHPEIQKRLVNTYDKLTPLLNRLIDELNEKIVFKNLQ